MWWKGQGKCSLAVPFEHLLSCSREPARQKGAVYAHCTVMVKNSLNSIAIVNSSKTGGEFQAIRSAKGIHHGLCQEHIFFCTDTKCLPFFLFLIISSGCRNRKYFHINSQVYKLGCDYSFPLTKSAQDESHAVMVCHSWGCLIEVSAFILSCLLLVSSACCQCL